MLRCGKNEHGERAFVRGLNIVFRIVGTAIARHPWKFISLSIFLATLAAVKIPITPMTNDVSDFTPYGARARKEIENYKQFFSNKGVPFAVYVLVTAKNDGNMLGIHELEETVQILDLVSDNFTLFNSATGQNESFSQFCQNFCTLNEPVRHFYRGFLVESNFQNSSFDHIDLSYPITTVLGRQLHMDPNFFGVKAAIGLPRELNNTDGELRTRVVSVNELRVSAGRSVLDDEKVRVHSNIREIKVIGLQFRAERPPEISEEDLKQWERRIVDYFQHHFKSNYVDVVVLTETFLTEEIVRAGLSLIPFLVIGFCVMSVFSSITMGLSAFYMGQMNIFKIFLAVMACVCPFIACGLALGTIFWLGLRFGSILCVTPFLVLAIGVDDAYLMVNAWQGVLKRKRAAKKLDSGSKIATVNSNDSIDSSNKLLAEEIFIEMIHEIGPSMTITSLTNVLAFTIGAFTPTPEIQLFSIGSAAAMACDYIYQFTFFGALMVIIGRYELAMETSTSENGSENDSSINTRKASFVEVLQRLRCQFKQVFRNWTSNILTFYCKMLTNPIVTSIVLVFLGAYLYVAIFGILNTRAELKPEKLFLKDSDVIRILELRNDYIMPFYAVCFVFVNKPGNISNPYQVQRLHRLVRDFESLPSSLGQFSTKFWLRDYEEFIESSEEATKLLQEDPDAPATPVQYSRRNELKAFLDWPEFDFWNGFVRLEDNSGEEDELKLSKFLFTTAFYGPELKEWSSRTKLLNDWRQVADSYPDLEVSVFEDDAKFLDLIPTMVGQTLSSSICTLILMFLVCAVFMSHPSTVLVATAAIISTCAGVFGILSLWGVDLDPIVMSAAIMSIGFSVDIPAHISYHFYKTGLGEGTTMSVQKRLEECISCIGFPVLEAGLSTIICVLSLSFVKLHMAQVFVKTMVLVISLGLIHGLLVIPVIFYLISLFPMPGRRKSSIEKPPKIALPSIVFPSNELPEKGNK